MESQQRMGQGSLSTQPVVQVALEPFVHQVGGHFPMVCLDTDIVCKPLKDREHRFYKSVPSVLRPFVPQFQGVMTVETSEDEDGYITLRGQPPPNYHHYLFRQSSLSGPPMQSQSGCRFHHHHYRLKRKESLEIEQVPECKVEISGKCVATSPITVVPGNGCGDIFFDGSEQMQKKHGDPRRGHGESGSGSLSDEEQAFYNPWALKCHRDHLKKIGLLRPNNSNNSSEDAHREKSGHGMNNSVKPQLYLLLENLVAKYFHPCILDLKVYNSMANKYVCENKYFGRTLDESGLRSTVRDFFDNGRGLRLRVIKQLVDRLQAMTKVVQTLDSFRFYTCSLLVTYDGLPRKEETGIVEVSEPDVVVDARIIDFAHSTHKGFRDNVVYSGPDEGFIFGLKNFIQILDTLIKSENECCET